MNRITSPRFCLFLFFGALVPSSIGFLNPQAGFQPNDEKPSSKKAANVEINQFPKLLPDDPIRPAANDDELKKLLIARFNEAFKELQELNSQMASSAPTSFRPVYELIFDANKRLLESRVDLSNDSKEEIEILSEYVNLLKHIEDLIEARLRKGEENKSLATKARYLRLDAEIQLLKAKRKQKK